jgi:adenosylcobinamide-GDP ribazoletransferase
MTMRTSGLERALGFLTPFRFGDGAVDRACMAWFPLAGALIGTAVGGLRRVSGFSPGELGAGGIGALVDAVLTGGLHYDGLADSADGLLPHADRERRLAIMDDPHVGAFGALALISAAQLKTIALARAGCSTRLTASMYALSRSAMALGSQLLPYARAEGLASAFVEGSDDAVLVANILGAGAATLSCGLLAGRRGVIGALVGLSSALAVLELAHRRLGGFTGDVLGAAGVLAESLGLLLATSARDDDRAS